jgi:hypothetical protein
LSRASRSTNRRWFRFRENNHHPFRFQQRLWFLDQLDPGNSAYNLAHAFEIKGPLDRGALRQSLNAVMARHEVLRTRFISNNGEPFQQVDLPAEVDWQVIDLENLAPEELAGETRRLLAEESRRPLTCHKVRCCGRRYSPSARASTAVADNASTLSAMAGPQASWFPNSASFTGCS